MHNNFNYLIFSLIIFVYKNLLLFGIITLTLSKINARLLWLGGKLKGN